MNQTMGMRVLSGVVAAYLACPAPSALAFAQVDADQLRPKDSKQHDDALSRLQDAILKESGTPIQFVFDGRIAGARGDLREWTPVAGAKIDPTHNLPDTIAYVGDPHLILVLGPDKKTYRVPTAPELNPPGTESLGKTYIVSPDITILGPVREKIDARVRAPIAGAFALGQAFQMGKDASPLTAQTDDTTLRTRVDGAHRFIESLIQTPSLFDLSDTMTERRFVYLVNDEDPALLHMDGAGEAVAEGDAAKLHLIGSSGSWHGNAPPTHYFKLALIEGARKVLGDDGARVFLGMLLHHEDQVWLAGAYVEPPPAEAKILDEDYAKIRQAYREHLAALRAKELAEAVTFVDPAVAKEFSTDILTPEVLGLTVEINREVRPDLQAQRQREEARMARIRNGEQVVQFRQPAETVPYYQGETATVERIRTEEWYGAIPEDVYRASQQAKDAEKLQWWFDAHPEYRHWAKVVIHPDQLTGPGDSLRKLAYGFNGVKEKDDGTPRVGIRQQDGTIRLPPKNYMIDFEDALKLSDVIKGLRFTTQAIHAHPDFRNVEQEMGYEHTPADWPLIIARPSGLQLDSQDAFIDGQLVSASVFATAAFVSLNAKTLWEQHHQEPYLYVPKINSIEDAYLWDKILSLAEDKLKMTRGTIKVEVLVERVYAMAELEEIMWVLRHRLVALNVGRYDYGNSWLEAMMGQKDVASPDWRQATMDKAFYRNYVQRVGRLAAKHHVLFIGGMAQQIPEKDQQANQEAMARVKQDKLTYEYPFGVSGAWMAHPGMARTLYETSLEGMQDKANQLGRTDLGQATYTPEDLAALLQPHEGERTEAGARKAINMELQFIAGYWGAGDTDPAKAGKAGVAAAAIFDTVQRLRLMEDRATFETYYKKLYELSHKLAAVWSDGRRLTPELLHDLLDDELNKVKAGQDNAIKSPYYDIAVMVLEMAVTNPKFVHWYTDLLHLVDTLKDATGNIDLDVARLAVRTYLNAYNETSQRLTDPRWAQQFKARVEVERAQVAGAEAQAKKIQPTPYSDDVARQAAGLEQRWKEEEERYGIKRGYDWELLSQFYPSQKVAPEDRPKSMAEAVVRLRGALDLETFATARANAEEFRRLVYEEPKQNPEAFIYSIGTYSGHQAREVIQAWQALKAKGIANPRLGTYGSGWVIAATENVEGETLPDQQLYSTIASQRARALNINKALLVASRTASIKGKPGTTKDWLPLYVMDFEAPPSALHAFLMAMEAIRAGVGIFHVERQAANYKICGHGGGGCERTTTEHEQVIKAIRLAADVLNVPVVIIGRSDATHIPFINNDDPRDRPFIEGTTNDGRTLTYAEAIAEGYAGEWTDRGVEAGVNGAWTPLRTKDRLYRVRNGVERAIYNMNLMAPYVDLVWEDTHDITIEQAERIADGVHAVHPNKPLGFNTSPNLGYADRPDEELLTWQKRLARKGYRWFVQTLAAFRNAGFHMFDYAQALGERGVLALAELQRAEREAAKRGYEGNLSQASAGGLIYDYVGLMAGRGPEQQFVAGSTEHAQAGAATVERAKTFIATKPGVIISEPLRGRIDARVRAPIAGAFTLGRAIRLGRNSPPLAEQTTNQAWQKEAEEAYAFLSETAKKSNLVDSFMNRRIVFLFGDDDPALLHTDEEGREASEGEQAPLHLIASSGTWHGNAPETIYLKPALITLARAVLGADGAKDFLGALLRHEDEVLALNAYADPSPEHAKILNEGYAKIQAYQQEQAAAKAKAQLAQRIKDAQGRAKKLAEKVQVIPYVMNLGRFYADGRVPDQVVQAIEQELADAKTRGDITDARVKRYGGLLFIQLTYNGPSRNPANDHVLTSIVRQAILPWHTEGVELSEAYRAELAGRNAAEQLAALRIRTGEFAYNEREAEPIYVAQALGGHVSAFNWPIVQIFLREAVENQQKLEGLDDTSLKKLLDAHQEELRDEALREGPGYVFVIERASDILAGTRDRTAYYLSTQQAPFIHVLVDDQTEWVITKVLPKPGTKLYDPSKPPLEQDPIASIAVDQVGGQFTDEEAFSPVFIGRAQSGSPAVGEFVSGTVRSFIAAAGAQGAYHRGVVPVTETEADAGTFTGDGRIQVVAYSYQSYAKGRIPPGVRDQVALSHDIRPIRDDDKWVHDALALHGSFQPHTTAPVAMGRAEEATHQLGARYHEIPAVVAIDPVTLQPVLTPAGKAKVTLDPVLEASNAKAVLTLSDLKADIGGDPGHQLPPDMYFATLRASLKAAQRAGLIKGYDVQNIGDDMHLVMFHDKGVDSAEIHTLAWESFFRSGWVMKQINYPELKGYQPYGFMQDLVDLKVSALIKQGKLEAFANLSDEFLQALEEEIQAYPEEARHMAQIKTAYEAFKQGKAAGTVLELPFSGNVRGQGIGFAEKALSPEEVGQWSMIASDKTGPGNYNFNTYWATRLALLLLKQHILGNETEKLWVRVMDDARQEFLRELAAKAPDVSASVRGQFATELFKEFGRLVTGFTLNDLVSLRDVMGNGVVYEVWDVRPNTRAFVDAQAEDQQLMTLLSATNEHNIKRMWSKKRAGWIQDLTKEELEVIRARVEESVPTLREELALRQQQVKGDLARYDATKDKKEDERAGKKFDQLTPWEQRLAKETIDEMLPSAKAQLEELLKIKEFLADDYFMSASTEKLAVAGGGKYLGKDDPTAWAIDALAKIYRAIKKVGVVVTLGDARGSHWVAVRPEGRATSVAVKWSNPVETSIRFTVEQNGNVPVDEHGRAKSEDMYADASYDEARVRVARFNERWIGVQGGFTPHGPNIEDVEAAYPYADTARKLTAPDSPFARPVTDTTAQTIGQAAWAGQFAAIGHQPANPADVAKMLVDTETTKTILLHESFFADAADGAIAVERLLDYARQVGGFTSLDEAVKSSALKFVVLFESEHEQPAAEAKFRKLVDAINTKTNATQLKAEWFTVVTQKPSEAVALAIGPKTWLTTVSGETTVQVALVPAETGEVISASAALHAGVETVAAGGKRDPKIFAKLKVLDESGVLVPESLNIASPEMGETIRGYQETVKAVGVKG